MKIAIFGASGGIGSECLRQALAQGHEARAFVRDPARLAPQHDSDRLSVVTGDLSAPADVEAAMRGCDAAICALGSRSLGATKVRREGTAAIIDAMAKCGVRRLFIISAMGVGESWPSLSPFNRFFFAFFLKAAREDHESQESLVKASGLDWTIVRPSALVDGPGTGDYQIGELIRAATSKIPRADVAHFILRDLAEKKWIGKAVTITN